MANRVLDVADKALNIVQGSQQGKRYGWISKMMMMMIMIFREPSNFKYWDLRSQCVLNFKPQQNSLVFRLVQLSSHALLLPAVFEVHWKG